MNADRKQKADRKKREKEARKKIYAIFKQIKAGCDQLKKFEETLKEVKKLEPILKNFSDVLGAATIREIQAGMDAIDQANQRGDSFCKLADQLKALTDRLYGPILPRWVQDLLPAQLVGLAVGAVTLVVLVGGLVTIFSPWFQATIRVSNLGCAAIPAPAGLPDIPGVSFWDQAIQDGESGVAKIPPWLRITVDAAQAGAVNLSIFGAGPFGLPVSGLTSLLLNGREIKGQVVPVDVRPRTAYDLVISCR